MTNFQGRAQSRAAWFTPERLVFVLPIAGGAALLGLLVVVGYPPLFLQWQQRRESIRLLEGQQAALPLLRSQLDASREQLAGVQAKQERLLALVAGTSQLRTWLASLNDIANASGVAVALIEPGRLENYTPPPPPPEGQATETAPATAATPADPLLVPKVQKRSAVVTLRGTYQALLVFLQRLEALQVVAIASDLELRSESPAAKSSGTQAAPAAAQPRLTELKLKLSAYGRAPGSR